MPAPLLRDQERALKAYTAVAEIQKKGKDIQTDYKISVHALGAEILQSGLAAAMAGLERRKEEGDLLRGQLAAAGIPGLTQSTCASLPGDVRALELDPYIIATRETLQVVLWLKRAVQAKLEGV